MAISPREAGELTDAEYANMTKAEIEVDYEIRIRYRPGYGPFSFTIPFELERVMDALCRRYRMAGWAECDWEYVNKQKKCRIMMEAGTTGDSDALAGLEPKSK